MKKRWYESRLGGELNGYYFGIAPQARCLERLIADKEQKCALFEMTDVDIQRHNQTPGRPTIAIDSYILPLKEGIGEKYDLKQYQRALDALKILDSGLYAHDGENDEEWYANCLAFSQRMIDLQQYFKRLGPETNYPIGDELDE